LAVPRLGERSREAADGRILIVEPSERRPTVPHLQVIANWYRLLP
jgi:hypothetical protein